MQAYTVAIRSAIKHGPYVYCRLVGGTSERDARIRAHKRLRPGELVVNVEPEDGFRQGT